MTKSDTYIIIFLFLFDEIKEMPIYKEIIADTGANFLNDFQSP